MATHVEPHPGQAAPRPSAQDDEPVGRKFFSIATPIIAAVLSLALAVVSILTAK